MDAPRTEARARKHWGWGFEDQQLDRVALEGVAEGVRDRLGFEIDRIEEPVPLREVVLPRSRLKPPAELREMFSAGPRTRAAHALGKAYRDVVRGFRGEFPNVPDLVAFPRSPEDVDAVLNWCAEHGLTLRHFPQSFEYATLGGWIATRAGGHYATVYTHIDDLVESVRAVTLGGDWISRRLPGSGAGPSPDRMLLGSEGILGVITDAWVRVQERPQHKLSCGVSFADFETASEAVRELSQSALFATNCRLLDATEAETTGAGPADRALLVLGFESAHHPVGAEMGVALDVARSHGGEPGEVRGAKPAANGGGDSNDPVSAWRRAFLHAPHLRDSLVACGVLSETFESAITWDRLASFHAEVMESARTAVAEVTGAPGEGEGSPKISCRFTHVYPDGPAPYFTVLAPARRGSEVSQWDEIKAAVSETLIDAGGTITHHHAVGRDHRPWYDRQRPDPFAAALRAAKRELDPKGVLNPGVLVDP